MELYRRREPSVQPNGSGESCGPGRTRSGILAFLRPRQTVSPGPHHMQHDQHAQPCDKTATPDSSSNQGSDVHQCNSDWSNLPDHLIESILHNLQRSEPDPLHPSHKPARLVRPVSAQYASLEVRHKHRHTTTQPMLICNCSPCLPPHRCPETGVTLAGGRFSRTYGIYQEALDTLCSCLDW